MSIVTALLLLILLGGLVLGIALLRTRTTIEAGSVGIVVKKRAPFAGRLPAGQLIATRGEAGIQAQTLSTGDHWGIWPFMFDIKLVPEIVVEPGNLGLVVAKDGASLPPGRALGCGVDCADFADAASFLANGGEKGRQLAVLTEGRYRINTELFDVVTTRPDGSPWERLYVPAGCVGIVTTLIGHELPRGYSVGQVVEGHDHFQNAQAFMDGGGQKGLQAEVLGPGEYTINPWFAEIELVDEVVIPAGNVGVIVSNVGERIVREPGTTEPLVDEGQAGVRRRVLSPGNHRINRRAERVVVLPTAEISLNWSKKSKKERKKGAPDADLEPLRLMSSDGFNFTVELTQVLRISPDRAPNLISAMGVSWAEYVVDGSSFEVTSIGLPELVTGVLAPTVDAFFRNAAREHSVMEFQDTRDERQRQAGDYVRNALLEYGVVSVATLIGEIVIPDEIGSVRKGHAIDRAELDVVEITKLAAEARSEVEVISDHERHLDLARLKATRELFASEAAFHAWHSVENWEHLTLPKTWFGGGPGGGLERILGGSDLGAAEVVSVAALYRALESAGRDDLAPALGRLRVLMSASPTEVSGAEVADAIDEVRETFGRSGERSGAIGSDAGRSPIRMNRRKDREVIEVMAADQSEPADQGEPASRLRSNMGRRGDATDD